MATTVTPSGAPPAASIRRSRTSRRRVTSSTRSVRSTRPIGPATGSTSTKGTGRVRSRWSAQERRDVEVVVAQTDALTVVGEDVDGLGVGQAQGAPRTRGCAFGGGLGRPAGVLPALETRGDDGHPHLVAH